jgi:hypothetical protein
MQDLAEQHRALRQIMGIGDWDDETSFNWRRIRNTLCLLKPETIEKINHLIVAEGHTIDPEAGKKVWLFRRIRGSLSAFRGEGEWSATGDPSGARLSAPLPR